MSMLRGDGCFGWRPVPSREFCGQANPSIQVFLTPPFGLQGNLIININDWGIVHSLWIRRVPPWRLVFWEIGIDVEGALAA